MPVRISNPVHLTVLDPIDTTFVSRLTSARKPAGEIFQPFQIAGFGGVAFTTDLIERAKSHLIALILTRTGERLMRPSYGTELYSYVFEAADDFVASELGSRLADAVRQWEPGINIISVRPARADAEGVYVAIEISFSISGFNEVHSTTFDLNGNRIEN